MPPEGAIAADGAPSIPRQDEAARVPAFDPEKLESSFFLMRWVRECFAAYPHRCMSYLRANFRIPWIPFLVPRLVLRYDDVREIFANDAEFPVPWAGKMHELCRPQQPPPEKLNFVLGMRRTTQENEPNPEYTAAYSELARAFRLDDIPDRIAEPSREYTENFLETVAEGQPFDAVKKLVTALPAQLCRSYYGIQLRDEERDLFPLWTLPVSAGTFGEFTKPWSPLAISGAWNLSRVIRASIRPVAVPHAGVPDKDLGVIQRMKRMELTDDQIHAHLFGMVMGFIPTNVLAGGNILETLLWHKEAMRQSQAAVKAEDDELLWRCLREALRFRNINPAMFRECRNGYTLGRGTPDERRIPKGKILAVSAQSAMFDERRVARPHVFDPYRRDEDYLIFGLGHWCIGAYIAKAQLTQMFKPLLRRKGLQAAKRPRAKRFSYLFPLHLDVVYRT